MSHLYASTFELYFFLGDDLLGIGSINLPVSTHYFCRYCGTVWARELILDPKGRFHEHTISISCCPEHAELWTASVHGIFNAHAPDLWCKRKPREVLARDFLYLYDQCHVNS